MHGPSNRYFLLREEKKHTSSFDSFDTANISRMVVSVYRNNLKNRVFDKKALRNSCLERETIVREQGSSEDKNCEVKPTPSETDSSGCFGIDSTLIILC